MKALLSVSFGTSYADTRAKTIDVIESKLRSRFPDLAFYSAWTSGRIVEKVKAERGEHHDTLDEAFARMKADGICDLVVATTCLLEGMETAKVSKAVEAWVAEEGHVALVAKPLLSSPEDRKAVARVILDEFAHIPEREALLLMGHGTEQGPNEAYDQVQAELRRMGRSRFFVATVEGTPTLADVLPTIEACGVQRVHLAPLMIVAGDHARNDLAGEGEASWASQLSARGCDVNVVLRGLGEYVGIHRLVCDHVSDALTLREVSLRG